LDGGLADGLCQVRLARAARFQKQRVFPLANKGTAARSKTILRFILGLKVKSKLSSAPAPETQNPTLSVLGSEMPMSLLDG
jgi:hypothetical protein